MQPPCYCYLNKSCIFFEDLLPYITWGPYIKCGASVASNSKFRMSTISYYKKLKCMELGWPPVA
jgi:hypothetical protein